MIIVSVTGPTTRRALDQIAESSRFADLFELRLDLISHPDMARLIRATTKPCVATCRPVWEGGEFRGPERKRIEILKEAAVKGARYVDLELEAGAAADEFLRLGNRPKVIISRHLSSCRGINVPHVYAALHATRAEIIKFAFPATDSYQIRHVIDFLERARSDRRKAIAIAMGEYGQASRVLYRKLGGWATYAAPENGRAAASGQIPASELKGLYRADRLTGRTRVFGVVGNPLGQSKGVYIHNALMKLSSQDAVYCKFPVCNLAAFMRYVAPVLSGCSVTIPYKEKILKYLDEADSIARGIGAVNTVVRRGRRLKGTNTDAAGALDAIERVMKVRGKRILIVGAGGAARAIAYESVRRGASVLIANRTALRARKLVRELHTHALDSNVRYAAVGDLTGNEFEILVNATSVGMIPHVHLSPVPKVLLTEKVVFDAVYNPPVTQLLKDAVRAGAQIISGKEMYLNQAALQFELYTGKVPDRRLMRRILTRMLTSH